MGERSKHETIEEIGQRLDLFLADPEISEEKKAEVVRELLVIAFEEM